MSVFRSRTSIRFALGTLLVAWVLMLGFVSIDTSALFEQTEDHGGSGGGCHCGEKLCGCAAPSAGCSLLATCSCPSTGDCTRECTYRCE